MESFKEKIPMIIAVIIVIALIIGAYYFLVVHKEQYYTQIDNTKIEEISGTDEKDLLKMVNAVNNDEDNTNNITLEGVTQNNIRNNRTYRVSLGYSNRNCK